MSRDPEDGSFLDPRTLHKYLYASGDPVNAFDPSGKSPIASTRPGICGGDMGEYACAALAVTAVAVFELPQVKKAEVALFSQITSIMDCINQYLRDLAACMSAYPAGGAQQARCIKAAKQAKELCIESFTGGGGGPVNYPTTKSTEGKDLIMSSDGEVLARVFEHKDFLQSVFHDDNADDWGIWLKAWGSCSFE